MKTLQHPTPVSEQEFLQHLSSLLQDEYVKRLVLAYYKQLRHLDHKHGKNLTFESFATLNVFLRQDKVLTDQATCLFSNQIQKIGLADFFRWQFVNFVDTIEVCAENDFSGCFNAIDKKLTICKIQNLENFKKPKQKAYQFFLNKFTVFHELTHLMTVRSANNGKYKYLSPWELEDSKTTSIFTSTPLAAHINNMPPEQQEIFLAMFSNGLRIINEIATELFASYAIGPTTCAQNSYFFKKYNNSPTQQTIAQAKFKKNQGLLIQHSEYQHLGFVLETIYTLTNTKNLHNGLKPPLDKQYKTIYNFFVNGTLSSKIQHQLDKKFFDWYDLPPNTPKNNFEKFVILFGEVFREFQNTSVAQKPPGAEDSSAYNQNSMLLQAMILDIHKNNVQKWKPELLEAKQNGNASAKTFVQSLIDNAKEADNWIIKPNIKTKTTGQKEKWARFVFSNTCLAKKAPNIALCTWVAYLQDLAHLAKSFDLLSTSDFLTQESNLCENNMQK